MSNQDKQEAAEKAARAASNATDATEAATEVVKDEVVNAAETVKTRVQNLAHRMIYTELGRGALIFGFGIGTTIIGVQKIIDAKVLRATLLENMAKADHHIRPEG